MCSSRILAEQLDWNYLYQSLITLGKVPTEVPLGPETLMEPYDPKLVHYVQRVVRPELERLGVYHIQEAPGNQLLVKLGEGFSDTSLLIMVYTPTQHANLMRDPFSPRIGVPWSAPSYGPCIYGQGMSQNKAHMAVMLTVLKLIVEQDIPLGGSLYFAVNNEGRSSHACTESILSTLGSRPQQAILLIGTGMRISLGNRGRVDINVRVKGKATHSSNPRGGASAIEGAYQVMRRLETIVPAELHPLLGKQQLLMYQLTFDPLAPHTLPEVANLRLDRRLLPGEDVDEAVGAVRSALEGMAPFEVVVERGVCMLPSMTDGHAEIVVTIKDAAREICDRVIPTYYSVGTFDAGGLTSRGIPTVMFGAGGNSDDILGDDFVPLGDLKDEAQIILNVITSLLGDTKGKETG